MKYREWFWIDQLNSVQSLSHVQLFLTPWIAAYQTFPPSPVPRAYSNSVHRVHDAIQSSHPLLFLLLLPSIFPSIRIFSNKSVLCITGPKYWSFSFNISPSNIYSGLISLELTGLTNVHRVSDAIQPSRPLLSTSAFNLLQHQGLF